MTKGRIQKLRKVRKKAQKKIFEEKQNLRLDVH